ncbi:MAG: ankyrin repeat domain-containing protein [Rickettsiaceae bacterium]
MKRKKTNSNDNNRIKQEKHITIEMLMQYIENGDFLKVSEFSNTCAINQMIKYEPKAENLKNDFNVEGFTPLLLAARLQKLQIMEILIEKKADVNYRLQCSVPSQEADYDDTVGILMWTMNSTYTEESMVPRLKEEYEHNATKLVISHGLYSNSTLIENRWEGYQFCTPVCQAVQHGKMPLLKLLLENGMDVNIFDGDPNTGSRTAITCAIQEDNIEAIKLLLEYGADLNFTPFDPRLKENNQLDCFNEIPPSPLLKALAGGGGGAQVRIPSEVTTIQYILSHGAMLAWTDITANQGYVNVDLYKNNILPLYN